MQVDEHVLERARHVSLADLVRKHGVDLKPSGDQLRGLCPFHSEKTASFYVNPSKGVYYCHGCGTGGDAIKFVQDLLKLPFKNAVRQLADETEIVAVPGRVAAQPPAVPVDELMEVVTPIPANAPPLPTRVRVQDGDKWVELDAAMSWTYRDAAGEPMLYIQRFELASNEKTIRPLTLWRKVSTDELVWKRQAYPGSRRPLYGLPELASRPKAQVLITEGEKACDAARRLLAKAEVDKKVAAVTWPGGANALAHVDLEPLRGRDIVIWPDADTPGIQAADDLASRLQDIAKEIKILPPPADVVPGWDAADAEIEPNFSLREFAKTARKVWPTTQPPKVISALANVPPGSAPVLVLDDAEGAPLFRPSDLLPPNLPRAADARDGTPESFPLTEKGNSYRFANKYGRNIRFILDLNEFLAWQDGRWTRDHGGHVVREAVGRLPVAIRQEATDNAIASPDDASHALKWAQKSESAAVISNTVTLIKDIPHLQVLYRKIDADPMLVGFDGGRQVIDLRFGEVRPARREDLVTRFLGVREIGVAKNARRWKKFVNEIFDGDSELPDWFQRWLGYCLSGLYSEQIFLFLYGKGANGKSVLLKVLGELAGGYGAVVQAGTLMQQQRTGKEASPDVLAMAGARFLLGSEVGQGEAFDERFLKSWTGGDLQKARPLHGKFVDFEPIGKLMLAGNHRPRIAGADEAVWRRVRLVPFRRQFAEHERDPELHANLVSELPHIAAWMVEGYRAWSERGLSDTPKAVRDASAEYKAEEDTLGEFLAEKTDSGGECVSNDLFKVYLTWAAEGNSRAMSRKAFGTQLRERGFASRRDRIGNVVLGLHLRPAIFNPLS